MKNIISAALKTGIQLVITSALKKEIPKQWLESQNVPVHSLSALKSGALNSLDSSSRGILVVITGAGLKASQEAALWIRQNLTPLFVVNIGTCGIMDKRRDLGQWIRPLFVSDEKDNTIELNTHLPLPCPDQTEDVKSLISVKAPQLGSLTSSMKRHDTVDMECFSQAMVFSETDISFHCLKFSTDYSDSNAKNDFNRYLMHFQEEFKNLLSFISNESPQITAIIPVFNRENTIRRAVDSILAQSRMPEEIIVVNDCSTDGTGKILDSYGDRITHIRLSKNAGPSAARNEGAKHAQTEWIAFLDSDDCWEKTKLHNQIEYLRKYPFYQILQSEEKWIRNGIRVNPCSHHKKPEGWIFEPSLQRCLISPSAVLLKKSLFNESGGFDESLPVCEDYDLWLKISRYLTVGLEPGMSVVKYGGHNDQLSGKYPAMDIFRVQSLSWLLRRETHPYFRNKISQVLKRKLHILIKGYEKRQNIKDADACRELLDSLQINLNFTDKRID